MGLLTSTKVMAAVTVIAGLVYLGQYAMIKNYRATIVQQQTQLKAAATRLSEMEKSVLLTEQLRQDDITNLKEVHTMLSEARSESERLRSVLDARRLDRLASKKSGLIQRRVNAAVESMREQLMEASHDS